MGTRTRCCFVVGGSAAGITDLGSKSTFMEECTCSTTCRLGVSRAVSTGSSDRDCERKYWYPVLFRILRITHQMKFVVKPPIKITTSTGNPCQRTGVPCFDVSDLMGSPAANPKAKQALM